MPTSIREDDLRALRELYDRGLYVQAWRQAEPLGPMQSWPGTAARLLAGRLAGNLGAPRLARVLHYRAWKEDPHHPEAAYYQAREIIARRGPLAAWEIQEAYGGLADAPREIQADFFALRALTLARLRDFDAAESWLAKAEALAPQRAWIFVERAGIMELEDRLDEALAAARHALKLRPWYRPAVQSAARVFGLLGRDADALELLTAATARTESFAIVSQLAALQRELGRLPEADAALARALDLAPLIEDEVREWLTCLRADAAYLRGDRERARDLSAACKSELFQKFAQRLAEPNGNRRRVRLPVGFVRQHHQTCAPATLAALTRYWGRPAEHLGVAEEICYDGTPQHRLRDWAERHGWLVREFTVTWDDVIALIDRGIPFALTVSRPGQAHLQAIIGYDRLRETWLVRDPGEPYVLEAGAESLLEYHRFSGPPGLALVPNTEAARLAGLTLTDQDLYDRMHLLCLALHHHNRPLAQQHYEALLNQDPEHRLTRLARMSLARYDGDITTHLRCVEQLLAVFPDEPQLLLFKLQGLRDLGRRADRMALLEALLARPDCDPLFRQEYAGELYADARQQPRAVEILRQTLRVRPDLAGCMSLLGGVYWQRRCFAPALALYRFALCTNDKEEDYAQAYFSAARCLRRQDESIAFLRSRFERFGRRSGRPARTLFWAYDTLERTREGFQLLEAAIALRPDDGDLLLFTAAMHGAYGRHTEARRLLAAAKPCSRRTLWLRTSANLARAQGRLQEALDTWRQVLAVEPVAADAHAAVARLLEATAGRPAAVQHLEETAARFPHSYPVHQLLIEWLRDEDLARAERAVRHLLEIHPADVWAHRELALVLGHQQRDHEALAEAEAAIQLGPTNPYSHGIFGHLALHAGQRDRAREALRTAIRLSADVEPAIADLVHMAATAAERREALAFIHEQLVQQVILGDGLLAYQALAESTLEPAELLTTLRAAHQARPDLWQTWLVLTRQLSKLGRRDEALSTARSAVRRFPLVARVWHELARVYQQPKTTGRRIVALQRVLEINPDAPGVARELAEILAACGHVTRARTLLEQALARDPVDAPKRTFLAELLWRQKECPAALAQIEQALRFNPGFEDAWQKLQEWGRQAERPDAAQQLAHALTEERPGDPQTWLALARVLNDPQALPERLAAIDRAIALRPTLAEAHDLRAALLADAGRFDEARSACAPVGFPAGPPLELRGRAAWVEAKSGKPAAAVEAMRAVLAERPDYEWGWIQLLEWLSELQRDDEALAAADQLLRLDPNYGPAYGYRGEIQLARKEPSAAIQSFEAALAATPDYTFAASRLFKLYLDQQAFDEAERILAVLKTCDHSTQPLALEVLLHQQRQHSTEARAALKSLCLASADGGGWLGLVVEHLVANGGKTDAQAVLEACLGERHARPEVGAVWAKYCIMELPRAEREQTLADLRRRGEIGWAATAAYLEQLGERPLWQFFRFVRRNRRELRSHLHTWFATGRVLGRLPNGVPAARWFKGWQEHPGLTPGQLLDVAVAFRRVNRDADAAVVSRHALTAEPVSERWYHELWLACDDALHADFAGARQRLLRAHRHIGSDSYYRFIYHAVNAVLVIAGRARDAPAFRAARAELRQAVCAFPTYARFATPGRIYRACARRIARENGTLHAALWALWCNRPRLTTR